MTSPSPVINWVENQETQSLNWHSENGSPAPKRVQVADDTMNAESAYRLACEGTALLWKGDFQNAKNLLQAIARRIDKRPAKSKKSAPPEMNGAKAFHLHRQAQAQRARVLGMLLIPMNADFSIPLRRAPDVIQACSECYEKKEQAFAVSLREILGLIGAHEWRKNGVNVPALGNKIHPYYGIFSPLRGEYLELIAKAPLPSLSLAFDIGTGTGVIAAVLARRGIQRIVATDLNPRALECANDNLLRLGLSSQVELIKTDLFPEGRAPLVVCNPPWIPARPNAAIEQAIYDPESRMLREFLTGVAKHLTPDGEAWLIMSDLAELLGLRSKQELWDLIDAGGLSVIGKMDIRPHHAKSRDSSDPLHLARAAEITSLWRLRIK